LASSEKDESSAAASDIQIVDGKQVVNSTLASGRYPNITVQAGTPVKWVIDAPKGSINGCNNRMLIQDYGIEYSLRRVKTWLSSRRQKQALYDIAAGWA